MKLKTWAALAAVAGVAAVGSTAFATHSWNGYHWARTTSSFTLRVTDSVNGPWQSVFENALNNWSASKVFDLTVVAVDDGTRAAKQCRAIQGEVRVCNAAYGQNGWLGLASIGLDSQGHIDQGTAKMNDSYDSYYTPEERNHVMCQEVGHVFGLGHTSEDGSVQSTCMDYSSDPSSQWPNAHDYEELGIIYAHLDAYNSYSDGSSGGGTCHGKNCPHAADAASDGASPPMGLLVHKGERYEIWVAPRADGGYWVHHVLLAPTHN